MCSGNDDSSLLVVFNNDSLDSDINDSLLSSNPVHGVSSEGQDECVFLFSDLLDEEEVLSMDSISGALQSSGIVDRDFVDLEFISSDNSDSHNVDESSGLMNKFDND